MAKTNLKLELKKLGGDIATAVKQMKNSREFKKLQKDVNAGMKSVAGSLQQAFKAARSSPETKKIKNRLNRVVKLGGKEGMVQARKAEAVAAQKIKQARAAIRKLAKKSDD